MTRSGCLLCGGFGSRHDPIAHDAEPTEDTPCGTCDGFGWNYDRLGARVTCPDCSGSNVRRERAAS